MRERGGEHLIDDRYCGTCDVSATVVDGCGAPGLVPVFDSGAASVPVAGI